MSDEEHICAGTGPNAAQRRITSRAPKHGRAREEYFRKILGGLDISTLWNDILSEDTHI